MNLTQVSRIVQIIFMNFLSCLCFFLTHCSAVYTFVWAGGCVCLRVEDSGWCSKSFNLFISTLLFRFPDSTWNSWIWLGFLSTRDLSVTTPSFWDYIGVLPCLGSSVGAGIWTQILMLTWPILYWLSHFPCSKTVSHKRWSINKIFVSLETSVNCHCY